MLGTHSRGIHVRRDSSGSAVNAAVLARPISKHRACSGRPTAARAKRASDPRVYRAGKVPDSDPWPALEQSPPLRGQRVLL
ncbi:hypothetical protein GCM10023205_22620 [Yinghuangia aomiensis]|uniref:Uncharacterized protein n=1 Tax=Yinghuangia aomiensis TaxID=676205 RepID=A0ABP9H1K8_9ACTN